MTKDVITGNDFLNKKIASWDSLSDPMLKAMILRRTTLKDDSTFLSLCRLPFSDMLDIHQNILINEVFLKAQDDPSRTSEI